MSEPTPDGRTGRVAAPCVFWMHGHETTFATLPQDHGNCSVGRFTHGLAEAADIIDKADVAALLEVGWVTMEAFAGVAALARRPAAISYGPLEEAEVTPDVVLLRVNPRQMMEIADAIPVEFSGKPQCQILPRAADRKVVAASMGCALSRARTGMGDGELTCAVPGERSKNWLRRWGRSSEPTGRWPATPRWTSSVSGLRASPRATDALLGTLCWGCFLGPP